MEETHGTAYCARLEVPSRLRNPGTARLSDSPDRSGWLRTAAAGAAAGHCWAAASGSVGAGGSNPFAHLLSV